MKHLIPHFIARHLPAKKPAAPRVRKERHDYKRDNILLIVAIHDYCTNYCPNKTLACGPCGDERKCPLRTFTGGKP